MIEESLFKTNYLGRDGFRWWVGQVAPNGEYTEGQSMVVDGVTVSRFAS